MLLHQLPFAERFSILSSLPVSSLHIHSGIPAFPFSEMSSSHCFPDSTKLLFSTSHILSSLSQFHIFSVWDIVSFSSLPRFLILHPTYLHQLYHPFFCLFSSKVPRSSLTLISCFSSATSTSFSSVSQHRLLQDCFCLNIQIQVRIWLLSHPLYIIEKEWITNSCHRSLVGFEWKRVGACCVLTAFRVAWTIAEPSHTWGLSFLVTSSSHILTPSFFLFLICFLTSVSLLWCSPLCFCSSSVLCSQMSHPVSVSAESVPHSLMSRLIAFALTLGTV